MPEIEVVKMGNGGLRGYTQDDQRRYAHFKDKFIPEMEAGEFFRLKYWQEPDPVLHRKLMALFRLGFDAWEPEHGRKRLKYKGQPIEKNFDQFRKEILIQAGFYNAYYDAKGRVHLEAKSLAFGKMTDDEKQKALNAVVDVMLRKVLPSTYTSEELHRVLVEEIQRFGSSP